MHVELLGSGLTVSQALPKARGTFQRGAVDRFSVELEAGRELGDVLAIKVWATVKGRSEQLVCAVSPIYLLKSRNVMN